MLDSGEERGPGLHKDLSCGEEGGQGRVPPHQPVHHRHRPHAHLHTGGGHHRVKGTGLRELCVCKSAPWRISGGICKDVKGTGSRELCVKLLADTSQSFRENKYFKPCSMYLPN